MALHAILTLCDKYIADGLYTSLVSLDIQGAFDNVEWRDIIRQLKVLRCPSNVAGVVKSYLSKRSVLINWGAGYVEHGLEKGCPQGSCLGPLLWLLLANVLLIQLEALGYDLFAFADDFSLVLRGRIRMDIETSAKEALAAIERLLSRFHLELSPGKSQTFTFSKPRKLEREPIMRINGKSIKHVDSIQILGITVDPHRSWTAHINSLKLKTAAHHINLLKLMGKNWGISTKMAKQWYHAIIEKILLYGAGVWGGNLTKQNKLKLMSAQRPFILQISRGFRTISTDALNVITGIPPLTAALDYEYTRCRILQLKDIKITQDTIAGAQVQYKIPGWQLHPAKETSHFQVNTTKDAYISSSHQTLFTDGSRTKTGVAAAYCVMKGDVVTYRWAGRLGPNNTIYQAELYALLKATAWCITQPDTEKFQIYSDSLSSLQAIKAHRTKHPLVFQIKINLQALRYRVAIGHVKAHRGTTGNEIADRLANEMTRNEGDVTELPLPPSYIKQTLKLKLTQSWQSHWDYSDKGRYTHKLIPKVSRNLFNLTPPTTAFLTGHGPFHTYLYKFKCKRTDLCECSQQGTPEHAYYQCELTERWHLRQLDNPPENWLHNILTRPLLRNKLREIYLHLNRMSDLT